MLASALCLGGGIAVGPLPAFVQEQGARAVKAASPHPVFEEADAVRVLSDMRQALESNNRGRLLKLFDARRMPGFAAFRDEIRAFVDTYDSVRMSYHLSQAVVDGEFGSAVADVTVDASPSNGGANFHKSARARLVLGWDGKSWKVVDFSPRDLFR